MLIIGESRSCGLIFEKKKEFFGLHFRKKRPPTMRTAVAFLASLAAASAFAPLPSYTRYTSKMTGPMCSTADGSRILQPFAERRALKVSSRSKIAPCHTWCASTTARDSVSCMSCATTKVLAVQDTPCMRSLCFHGELPATAHFFNAPNVC